MEITATELKTNLGKYLEECKSREIIITKNGKAIARLIGEKAYEYDQAELAAWQEKMAGLYKLGEATVPEYGSGSAKAGSANAAGPADTNAWMLTHNGEPVARIMPAKKPKRKIGFIKGPPASEETIAALFESEWSDEDYERWLNEKW